MADVRITAGPYEFRARWEREKSPKSCEAFGGCCLTGRESSTSAGAGSRPTSFASKLGQLAGNHFLTITDGLENLRPLGEMTLWKGAQDIVFDHG
jgi:hypothetical protein